MPNDLTELQTTDDLDRLVDASRAEPVLIYKHSLTCGTSGMALEEIRDLLAGPPLRARVGLVLVQSARVVSTLIASRFGVRHESPQELLVRDGQVIWHASHFRVTAEAITRALQQHGPDGTAQGTT
jgi:bacillithiol system protein YtxJ